jgi:anti-sigma regulatory factor (Ser/Thr protein kinase)
MVTAAQPGGCLTHVDHGYPSIVHRSFRSERRNAQFARGFAADTLQQAGAPADVVRDLRLATSELASNIIEHGDGSGFDVSVEHGACSGWSVEVSGTLHSTTPPLGAPELWAVAAADERSGRGLGIVRMLMDDVIVTQQDRRVLVRCTMRSHDGCLAAQGS